MIAQGPRAHGLSDDRNLITELLAQDLDGFHHAPRVWVSQEVRRYLDVTDISIDWLAHLNGGPVVLLFPLNLATQRRRLLNNREHRHDAVKTQLRVARRCQTRHQLWDAVGIWKWRVHQVHQFHGRYGGWITDGCAVDWFSAQGSQHSLTTGHWTRTLRFHICSPSHLRFSRTAWDSGPTSARSAPTRLLETLSVPAPGELPERSRLAPTTSLPTGR